MMWMMNATTKTTISPVIIAVSILLGSTPAVAHGSASWIMESAETRWCCGIQDCRRLKAEEVTHDATGWRINGLPVANVYPTKPEGGTDYWACFNLPELVRPRCLFVPAMF